MIDGSHDTDDRLAALRGDGCDPAEVILSLRNKLADASEPKVSLPPLAGMAERMAVRWAKVRSGTVSVNLPDAESIADIGAQLGYFFRELEHVEAELAEARQSPVRVGPDGPWPDVGERVLVWFADPDPAADRPDFDVARRGDWTGEDAANWHNDDWHRPRPLADAIAWRRVAGPGWLKQETDAR